MEQLIPILVELTEKYTSKESTSVSYQTAKQLMNAVIYCVDEINFVYNEADSRSRLESEIGSDGKTAYMTGYELVVKKVLRSKALFEEIALDFNAYRNRAYYETVIEGMPAFFIYYDPKFNPQNHILTLDYPTIKSVQSSCGIDAIYEYLCYTKLEQELLKVFPEEYITTLLSRYHTDYEELFINIAGIVLRNIIVCMIVGKNITDHHFEKTMIKYCENFLRAPHQKN